jgi:hypothetical protein
MCAYPHSLRYEDRKFWGYLPALIPGITTSARAPVPTPQQELLYATYDFLTKAFSYLAEHLPLAKWLVHIFDLPALLATDHVQMCSKLCEAADTSADCLGAKNVLR